jgi:beta-glucanase (GH16 family)
MRKVFFAALVLAFVFPFYSCRKTDRVALTSSGDVPVTTVPETANKEDASYKLIWFDEFNLDGLPDEHKWNYDVGASGWGNNELEYYTMAGSGNAKVTGGKLIIEARKEIYNGRTYYTSARLTTKYRAKWTYGKFEIKAKIPKGVGTWPTIWLLSANEPVNWPQDGELDIMEAVGYNANVINGVAHNFLYNGANGLFKGGHVFVPDAQDSFHVYSMEWTDKKITWSVDNDPYFSYSDPGLGSAGWPYMADFYLILNIAVGGNYGGKNGVDDSIFPQQMVIDYVRVYQKKP